MQTSPFTIAAEAPVVEMHELEGLALPTPLTVRELLWGDKAVLVEMSAPRGFAAPSHAHEHESFVYVLSGRIRATVEAQARELGPGEAVLHAAGAVHQTRRSRIHVGSRSRLPRAQPGHRWDRDGQ